MPLYVYENDEGERIEELRLSKDKDVCPEGYKRVNVPQPIAFTGIASNPASMKDGVLKGYYDQECKHGSKWKSEFSKKQIKQAWSN
jgi:hypothetical protein